MFWKFVFLWIRYIWFSNLCMPPIKFLTCCFLMVFWHDFVTFVIYIDNLIGRVEVCDFFLSLRVVVSNHGFSKKNDWSCMGLRLQWINVMSLNLSCFCFCSDVSEHMSDFFCYGSNIASIAIFHINQNIRCLTFIFVCIYRAR